MPRASRVGSLTGPLCFDVVRDVGDKQLECSTIVLYDIAGECCTDVRVMKHFGSFVAKSDGVIALLEPGQLGLGDSSDGAQAEWMRNPCGIFNVVYDMLAERDNGGKVNVPMAVCISKSDMISGILPTECRGDITPVVHPSSGDPIRKFNATAYNPLEKLLADQMRHGAGQEVHGALRRGYKHFNYFAFSATGCAVEKMDGLSYPKAPPVPLRIAEPLLWLFYKFGYIGSDVPIRLPVQREMPESVPETVKGPLPFMKKTVQRPLTDEEKERYWYESRT